MPKRVVFFNHFHNGDIHVSRGFVRQIMNKVHQLEPSTQFVYTHKMSPDLLSDIPNLMYDRSALNNVGSEHNNLVVNGDNIYINTWYGQQHFKYMNRHGVTIDTIYDALDDSCKSLWGFSLSDISADPSVFFPIIDYTRIQTSKVQNWLNVHLGQKILIENGPALSNQSDYFPMGTMIENLARKYPDKLFILTSPENVVDTNGNIFHSDTITQRQGRNDLNEISYLSTHCDVIIGRASGVWSFTLTQENLFKRRIKYLCFSNLTPKKEGKFWLGGKFEDTVNYSSTFITANESNVDKVRDIIEANL